MAAVAFEHVDKRYPNGFQAVRDCSLAIADRELLVLVGPSGCGKSTLLRMLAGLEDVTAGTIRIDGEVLNERSPQERNVAMVFQDYALYPFMTVRKNLEFPLTMRRLSRAEIARRVAWVSEMLDLEATLERLPKQLSGGQRQRVAMGRALVREPSVSLLDEPLSNLDAKLRVEVRAQIAELQGRVGTTMIYVTHDQTEAMTLGHRIAVLDRGILQQVAPPQELYDRPANVFVAGFIGNPPMNILPAQAAPQNGALRLVIGDQSLSVPAPPRGQWPARLQLGVRPEALHALEGLASPGSERAAERRPPPDGLAARVEHVELLGHETLLHAACGEHRLVARLPGMPRVAVGDRIRLAPDPDRIHLFDESGAAL
jgi:ABC-type sugar transport system ATPase subunit